MANNVQSNSGSGGAIWMTDDVSGVHVPYCKIAFGPDDTATIVTASVGFPVNVVSALPAGANVIGAVTQSGSWTISGTVTANAGTNLNTSLLALESGGNLAGSATSLAVMDDWDETDRCKVNIIAGQVGVAGGSGTVSALTQRVVLATDVALPAGTNAIGKLSANSGVDIGDVDVTSVPTDPFGANADAQSASGSISAKLRFIATTGIPVTGTVTVGTHAVTQSGTWSVRAQDGSGNSLTSKSAGSERAITVAVVDASGNQVTSFGGAGGTASNFGSAIPSTGTAAGFSDGTNMQLPRVHDLDSGGGTEYNLGVSIRLPGSGGSAAGGSTSNPIQVGDAGGSLTVDGSVTANAGTNLNTSLLALESGGNLAGAATSLAILDDWDESDRAKVNLIVGQAGVAAGSGAVGATTQRVILATDDPAVTSLAILDDWDDGSDRCRIVGAAAHDAAATGNPVLVGAEYDDSSPDAVDEGDVGRLRISANRCLYVNIRDNAGNERGLNVDGSGNITEANSANALTALQLIDDVVHSGDAAVSKYNLIGAVFDDVGTGTVTENQANSLRMSSRRALLVEGVASGTAFNCAQSGTWNVDTVSTVTTVTTVSTLTSITNWGNVADNAGFTDGTTRLSMSGFIFDEVAGTALTENDAAAARIDSKRSLIGVIEDESTRGRRCTVTAANALKVDPSAVTLTGQGVAAHDAAVSGNPNLIAGKSSAAVPTAVNADGDTTSLWTDRNGRLIVKQQCDTGTLSNVGGSASSVTLLSADSARKGVIIFNDSTADLYVKFGATASTSSFTHKMTPNGMYEVPNGYTGRIDGIWSSATGNARITELS